MGTRRDFLRGFAVTLAVLDVPWARGRATGLAALPVVSLYMDKPYVDLRGQCLSYEARGFIGGAGPFGTWSEQQWRMHHPYI